MRLPLAFAMIATGILGGCVSMTPEQQRAADEATCRSYGFRDRSDAFANCLLQMDLDRNADRRAFERSLGRSGYGFGPPPYWW